ncbi:MAG: M42 family peptidase [Dehalococcoidia bacterium]|nr:M42 family peptidase [Dehalococcoidia bacterium]
MPALEALLEELSNAHGPSGFEGPVRTVVRRELEPLADAIETDGLGSLMARLGPEERRPRVMLTAHMDELGLMVRRITPEGYLKFQPLGGWLDQALINQRWVILTHAGPVPGITGIKTVHVMEAAARAKLFERGEMFIDIGARDRADAEQRLAIRPGDPIVPDSRFAALAGGEVYLGKAWDDRVGLAVMIEVMRALRGDPSAVATTFAVATVQEEVGLRGAETSARHIAPDVGINLESGVAGDYPGITADEAQERLGGGPTLFLHDSSMLPNLRLRDFVMEVAASLDIAVQFNVLTGYGEDGAAMQRSGSGVPAINIAVPTRYLHSHNGLIARADVEATIRLVTAVVRRLDGGAVATLRDFG